MNLHLHTQLIVVHQTKIYDMWKGKPKPRNPNIYLSESIGGKAQDSENEMHGQLTGQIGAF
jgi:hypothetical protein